MQIYKSISKKENLNIFNNTNEKNYIKDEINTLKNSQKIKSNNIINSDNEDSDSFKDGELNIVTNTDCKINFHNNKKLITNVNSDLKELISDNKNLPVSKINLIPITGDGNCFYRCVSYFFINDEEGYEEIKAIIIEWIEHNYNQYLDFFGDDENNYLSIEEIAKRELDYIKLKDSWGSDYTISITCLIFNINIAVYVFNGNNEYIPYHFFTNEISADEELMILSYHNNDHFDLIYSKNEYLPTNTLYKSIKNIKINENIKKESLKITGTKFTNNYVKGNFKNSPNLYNEIANFLFSIKELENEINDLQRQNPNWHYNQILSKFDLKYPKRLEGKDKNSLEKKKNFRKYLDNYILDNNNRLCVLNPISKKDVEKKYYKIPYEHEKENIINDNHSNFNHAGREATYQNIINNNWYWYGMVDEIKKFIKACPNCNTSNKFQKLKGKNKIILENGPHYRYVADLWQIPKEISRKVEYKYILDIVDHFSKWYYGYLLHSKEAEEVLKNIEIYIENFGKPKILQTDNGKEFDNQHINNYCKENDIKLIHSSPYHPQTNGTVEVTHKEIQKYIFNAYMTNKDEFKIEDALFNIIKIHNNKLHTTTKRIPKEIRDLDDEEEITNIKNEIIKTLERKNKNTDKINYEKFYVIDANNTVIDENKIVKRKGKKKDKKTKNLNKIPVLIITNIDKDEDNYWIEIKKKSGEFLLGDVYEINIELLEEVEVDLWNNLL